MRGFTVRPLYRADFRPGRIGLGPYYHAVCLSIVALNMLAVLIFLFVDRPEPTCLRLDGDADIEVTTDALASIARTAASERDVMVEDVRVSIAGRDRARADISIEAILLARCDIESVAHRVQHRVQTACDDMLGVSGARVRVRFLPSTTETITKELPVSDKNLAPRRPRR